MTEQELMKLIEETQREGLHPAPDYLKDMILRKAEQIPVHGTVKNGETAETGEWTETRELTGTGEWTETRELTGTREWTETRGIIETGENIRSKEITENRTSIKKQGSIKNLDYQKSLMVRKGDEHDWKKQVSKRKKIQLFAYSVKAIAATAAALILVFHVPPMSQNTTPSEYIQQEQYRRQQKRQEAEEKMQRKKDRISVTEVLNEGTGYVCNQLAAITDNILEKENR